MKDILEIQKNIIDTEHDAKVLLMRWQDAWIVAMGDTIDVVSLIYQYSLKYRIILPVFPKYMENIKTFFPLDCNIVFYPILSFTDMEGLTKKYEPIRLYADNMYYKGEWVNPVIESIYLISGFDFTEREKYCTIREQVSRIPQIEPPTEPYAFIPEGGSEKVYKCDRKYVGKGLIEIVPPQDALMLSYAKIIENATEIHCHPTSWHRLIDKLPTKGKLFWHLYARGINLTEDQYWLLKDWNILGKNPYVLKDKKVVAVSKPNPKYKLSILICNTKDRLFMLNNLLDELYSQGHQDEVQILWLGDNFSMTTGEKRNWLKTIACGEYINYFDDDDLPSKEYIEYVLQGIKQNPDVVCFEVQYHDIKQGIKKHVYFSKEYVDTKSDEDVVYRKPNHLTAVKRTIAPDFPAISYVEDDYYGSALKPLIKTEVVIPKILYYYNYNQDISLGSQIPKTMDVIIVSDGTKFQRMTQDCIDSLNSKCIPIVIEKNKDIKYDKSSTQYQEGEFNYNKYLNEGASAGTEEFICFSNNDILFCRDFLKRAIWEMKAKNIDVGGVKDHNGYFPTDCITGWCFIMRRSVWNRIGKLHEDFKFWASDCEVTIQIKDFKYQVLETVFVIHKLSKTLNTLSPEMKLEYKDECVKKYNKKHNLNLFQLGT